MINENKLGRSVVMNYTLMHKNIKVADLLLDEETGSIVEIGEIYNFAHLPIGTTKNDLSADRALLNKWWTDRSIPASRSGVRDALEILRVSTPKLLLAKCYGLSLSDQYWVKPINSDLEWEVVNFFDNDFSEDVGDILFGKAKDSENISLNSPDNTSDGCLKKRWKIINQKRCLLKAGSLPYEQQPFNEAIASLIMDKLNIDHVSYSVMVDDEKPYSVCEDFISRDTELVMAWKILQRYPKPNHLSVYQHYIDCCKSLGIDDIVDKINQMIVVDFIIANEDRHLNNFGLVRNANTLEWIDVAPIFDSGSSLGYDKVTPNMDKQSLIVCKPFKKTYFEQLKLVTSFDWIDFDALKNIDNEILGILNDADENLIDDARKQKIISSINQRIEYIHNLAMEKTWQANDDINKDVENDIAEDYSSFDMSM